MTSVGDEDYSVLENANVQSPAVDGDMYSRLDPTSEYSSHMHTLSASCMDDCVCVLLADVRKGHRSLPEQVQHSKGIVCVYL